MVGHVKFDWVEIFQGISLFVNESDVKKNFYRIKKS